MATLTIRNLPDDVHAALRVRAARAGRSMEEEVRVMIAELAAAENVAVTNDQAMPPEASLLAKADAAAEAVRSALRAANNGRLPSGSVDTLIAERRAEAAREEAEYAQSVADRARRSAP
jgi:plasmid stability protein